MDGKRGVELLRKQIEEARRLLGNRPIKSAEYFAWNNATREYLAGIYGSNSPNIETIISAPGRTPVWMGMSAAVLEKYRASSMENKIKMLEACVLWLNLQIEQAAENIDNQ